MRPSSSIWPARRAPTTAIAIGAAIAAASPRIAVAGEGNLRIDAFATVSPFAAFDTLGDDGHGPEGKGIWELGVGGAVSHRFGRYFDLGLALHYDYGRGNDDGMHMVAAPITATLVIPLGSKRELHAGVGLGPAVAGFPDYDWLGYLGASAEVVLGFSIPLHPGGPDLHLQSGIRLDLLPENNDDDPDSYLRRSELLHGQLPFLRGGVTWR